MKKAFIFVFLYLFVACVAFGQELTPATDRLFHAVVSGDGNDVIGAVQAGADVNAKNLSKRYPLENATLENTRVLLGNQDISQRQKDEALRTAVIERNPQKTQMLLQAGADPTGYKSGTVPSAESVVKDSAGYERSGPFGWHSDQASQQKAAQISEMIKAQVAKHDAEARSMPISDPARDKEMENARQAQQKAQMNAAEADKHIKGNK